MPTSDERPLLETVRALVCEVALLRGVTPAVVCVSHGLPITYATDIAALLGVPTGTRAVGPVTPALTVRS